MSTPHRTERGPFAFLLLAVMNAVGLILINTHDWWRPLLGGVVTERFAEVVWAANLSTVVQLVGNALMLRWFTRLPMAAFNLAFAVTGFVSAVVTLSVFPFDLVRFGNWAEPAGRLALGLVVFVSGVGALGAVFKLVVALAQSLRRVGPRTGPLKARVVYESMFGNTRDVALAIAQGLRRFANVEVEVKEVGEADVNAPPCDLLVVGGPVHAWSMTRGFTRSGAREQARKAGRAIVSAGIGMRDFLEKLPENEQAMAATFDTAGHTKWFPVGSAARPAARTLDELGYRTMVKPEHFYVQDVMGPLLDGELARAEAWGVALGARCTSHVPGGTQVTLQERTTA